MHSGENNVLISVRVNSENKHRFNWNRAKLAEYQTALFTASLPDINICFVCRDGGLKRAKVKDTFKEEQQKLYSKMLVGTQEDRSRS